jgi:hypothetical protein
LLWVGVNDRQGCQKLVSRNRLIFDEGHLVGEFAKKLFPAGIDIGIMIFSEDLKVSKSCFKEKQALFEAGFLVNRVSGVLTS